MDLSNCPITDWSDLKYFPSLRNLEIVNADFKETEFYWELNKENIDVYVQKLVIKNCVNCDKIKGIDIFLGLTNLVFEADDLIDCDILKNLISLSELSISECSLINEESLENLKISRLSIKSETMKELDFSLPVISGLKSLYISGNDLEFLSGNGVYSVTHLDASNNKISYVPDNINQVFSVDLSNNKIENIDWYKEKDWQTDTIVSGNFIFTRSIYLYGNPLCDSAIKQILEYNYSLEQLFKGEEGEVKKIETNNTSPFKWLGLNKLRFEVEDENICHIDASNVEFKSAGETTVKIYYNNGSSGNENCVVYTVNVSKNEENNICDVDGNGIVDAEDALYVLKMAAHLIIGDASIADVNEDSLVDASDALYILKVIAKIK